jgi:glycosyltransferase involved in cell wall biosynthesis
MSSGSSKRVLILELGVDGHHPFYVRLLLDSGLADSAEIILASQPKMFAHPAIAGSPVKFRPHPLELALSDETLWTTSPAAVTRRSWTFGKIYRRAFMELSKNAPIDFVIVPYIDDCLLGLAAPRKPFGDTAWLAITMRTMFHYDAMGVRAPKQRFAEFRRWLTYRMLRQKCTAALLTIDPTLAEFAARQSDPLFRKIRYVPDPAPQHSDVLSKQEARQRLNIARDACLVLVYGAISARKGIVSLLEAAAAPECSRQIHVLFAGRIWGLGELEKTDAWQSLTAQRRMHMLNGFVDDEHERLIMAAADCMWVGYIDFYGVSSVMALAGRHAMPVLASDYGLVGHLAKTHHLGAVIEPRDQLSIVHALNRLVNEPDFFIRAGRNGVAVYQDHGPFELQRLVTDAVAQSWARGGCD